MLLQYRYRIQGERHRRGRRYDPVRGRLEVEETFLSNHRGYAHRWCGVFSRWPREPNQAGYPIQLQHNFCNKFSSHDGRLQ